MFQRCYRVVSVSLLLTVGIACGHVQTSGQVQLSLIDDMRWAPHPHLVDMVDNAILQDMAIADFHFVGHSPKLSGTGLARLDRMAPMLNTYGGTVRYETSSKDNKLIDKRLMHVREYLEIAGCDVERISVTAMISGGRGMPADQAIEIYDNATRIDEGSSSSAIPLTFGPGG